MRLKAIFVVFLLATLASADTISDINLVVGSDGYAFVEERIIYEYPGDSGNLSLPSSTDNLAVTDEVGNVPYTLSGENGGKVAIIRFTKPLELGQTEQLWIRYGTHYLTAKEGGQWNVSFSTPTTPRKTIIRLTLPEGSNITSLDPYDALRTYVKDGIWIYPQDTQMNFSVSYEYASVKPNLENKSTGPGNQSIIPFDTNLFLGIILVVVFLLVLVILYSLYKNRLLLGRKLKEEPMNVSVIENIVTEPKVDDGKVSYDIAGAGGSPAGSGGRLVKESVLKMLDDTELSIIRLLENSDEEEVTQAYIHKTTGVPKSSLSDILKHMEKRNILERRESGRVKWIKLKSWVLE